MGSNECLWCNFAMNINREHDFVFQNFLLSLEDIIFTINYSVDRSSLLHFILSSHNSTN